MADAENSVSSLEADFRRRTGWPQIAPPNVRSTMQRQVRKCMDQHRTAGTAVVNTVFHHTLQANLAQGWNHARSALMLRWCVRAKCIEVAWFRGGVVSDVVVCRVGVKCPWVHLDRMFSIERAHLHKLARPRRGLKISKQIYRHRRVGP